MPDGIRSFRLPLPRSFISRFRSCGAFLLVFSRGDISLPNSDSERTPMKRIVQRPPRSIVRQIEDLKDYHLARRRLGRRAPRVSLKALERELVRR